MASLEGIKVKSGTHYRVVYMWAGRKERFKIGVTSRRVAHQRKAQVEAMLAMGRNPQDELTLASKSAILLSELLRQDSEWCSTRKHPKTVNLNRWAMERLIDWGGDRQVSEITHEVIERYLSYLHDELGCNETTVNMQLRILKAIFQRAVDEYKMLPEHSFRSVKQYTQAKNARKPNYLTVEQVELLLNSIDDEHFRKLTQFYLWTGCRRTEAVDLIWKDVDWLNGVIYLGQADSQTKVRRAFPLSGKIEALIEDMKRDRKDGQELVF